MTGEVVRRVTGRSIQELYEERVRAPYGLDLYMGFPESLEDRFLPAQPMAITPEQAADLEAAFPGPDSLLAVAFNMNSSPPIDVAEFINIRKVRALGQASAGGVGNASGVAGMYAAAIGEFQGRPPLLEPRTIAEFAKVHSSGIDMVTAEDHGFGLGFEAQGLRYRFLGADAFGHSGAAGAQGFADPSSGVAYGYVRRRFHYPPGGRCSRKRSPGRGDDSRRYLTLTPFRQTAKCRSAQDLHIARGTSSHRLPSVTTDGASTGGGR